MHVLLHCIRMKRRVALTLDPEVARKAKRIAHARHTSVSALVEDLVRRTPISSPERKLPFVETWSGRFRVKQSSKPDPRLAYLQRHYGISDE